MVVNQSRPFKVVVVGGSYAGLSFVQNLLFLSEGKPLSAPLRLGAAPELPENARIHRRVQIVLVDERDGFFHTFGSPLAHVARPYVRPLWRQFRSVKWLKRPDVQVQQLTLKRVDPQERRAVFRAVKSGEDVTEDYDYLVLATGLRRDWPIVPQTPSLEKYVEAAEEHVGSIEDAKESVVVVGGGAVGIEFAGELKNHHPSHKVILVHSKDQLLSNEPLSDEFKAKALEVLREEGVEVMLGQRPTIVTDELGQRILQFKDGRETRPGFVVDATTKWTPATEYLPLEALDPLGYVKIQPNLTFPSEVPNAERHFAIGDMTLNSGIKRAGGAMAMGRVTAINLFCSLLREEDPHYELKYVTYPAAMPPMMALAIGKQAVLCSPVNGLQWGVEKMSDTFSDDLGWKYMLRFLEMTEVDE